MGSGWEVLFRAGRLRPRGLSFFVPRVMIDIPFLVLGLIILMLGGEMALRGAVGLARFMGVSPAIIGLTVMGIGTSAPELVVAVRAAFTGNTDIAVGNAIGSNIANTLLILGSGALIRPLSCDPRGVRRDGAMMLFASLLLCGLGLNGGIAPWQGGAMLTLLAGFMWLSYRHDRRDQNATTEMHEKIAEKNAGFPTGVPRIIACILGGFVGLAYGAALLVESAVAIAEAVGVSQSVIGLTLIAFGTSVPELAATMIAAYRNHTDVAVANILGSNIFNILGVLGAAALFGPLGFSGHIVTVDQWIMLLSAVILLPVMITGMRVSRVEGAIMLGAYAAVNSRFLY